MLGKPGSLLDFLKYYGIVSQKYLATGLRNYYFNHAV